MSVSEVALTWHKATPTTGNLVQPAFGTNLDKIYKHFRLIFFVKCFICLVGTSRVPLHTDQTWNLSQTFQGQKSQAFHRRFMTSGLWEP